MISESDAHFRPNTYYNVDGQRFEDGRYAAFTQEVSAFVDTKRQFTDAVRTFAYGTDASFYRLNPRMVIKIQDEAEVARILPIAHKHKVPVTFRAAGTSLSGQALTDSVLLKLSHNGKAFRNYTVHVSLRRSQVAVRLLVPNVKLGRSRGFDPQSLALTGAEAYASIPCPLFAAVPCLE